MIPGTSIAALFTQVKVHQKAAPPAPPDTWGAYQKKDGKSNGVIALMEMLIKELEDGITTSKHEEEAAQADLDTKIEETKEKKVNQETTLENIKQLLLDLHAKCDFIIENFDMRKAARETEKEGLDNAKSVLSGANFE